MNDRAYAIDALRGLAIIGMVFSGYIAWNADLPAWLFHAQVPPPAFTFDGSLPGITWVDLVFPFFLFAMGAAFPMALGRKLDRGIVPWRLAGAIGKRGVLLVFFAIALGNLRMGSLDAVLQNPALSALATWVVWGGFFALFVRMPQFSSRQNNLTNALGGGVLGGMLVLYGVLDVPINAYQSDVIILILANVVVFGSFLWWLTRRQLLLRMVIVALLVALKIGGSVEGSWTAAVWNGSFAPWLFRTEYLQYLCIVLPGSVAGEQILRWLKRKPQMQATESEARWRVYLAALCALGLIVVNLWGLYARHLTANFVMTLLLGVLTWWLLRNRRDETARLLYRLFATGFFWLLLGLLFEPFEGGIKKDLATISYLFVTSGLASLTLLVATVLLEYLRVRPCVLAPCGQNPMIAYTVAGYVVMPLLSLLNVWVAIPWLWGASSCAMSIGRSVIVVAATVLITLMFTRRKIFWRT